MPRTKRSYRIPTALLEECDVDDPQIVNKGGRTLQVQIERLRHIDLLGIEYLIKKQLSYEAYKRWRRRSNPRYNNQESYNEEDTSHQQGNDSPPEDSDTLKDINSLPEDNDSLQDPLQDINSLPEDNDSLQNPLQEINSLPEDNDSLQDPLQEINLLPEDNDSLQDPLLEEKPFQGDEALHGSNSQENNSINKSPKTGENRNRAPEPRLSVRTDLISPTHDADDAWEKRINIEAYTIADSAQTDFDLPNDNPKKNDKRNREDSRSKGILYCNDCCWGGECPVHGPLFVVENRPIPPDVKDFSRAKRTLPFLFTLADSQIPDAGSGVWARQNIPARTRFGPYEGQILSPHLGGSAYSWMTRKTTGEPLHCIDATEPGLANWMRYVNFARDHDEQNLEAFQYEDKVYYITMRTILQNEELLVWYGDGYGRHFGSAPTEASRQPQEAEFTCSGCSVSFASPDLLMQHESICKEAIASKQQQMPSEPYSEIKVKEEFIEDSVPFQEEILINDVKTEIAEDPLTGESTAQMAAQDDVKNGDMISDVFVDPMNMDDIPEDSLDGSEGLSIDARTGTEGPEESSEADCSDEESSYPTSSEKVRCRDCRKMVSRCSLRLHRLTHTGKKPFVCNLCKESFYSMNALNAHQSMHSALRPFACGLCSQRFVRSTLLRYHVLAEHADEADLGRRLRYSCKQCPEKFTTKKLMREHSLEHSPRPFVCGTCNKRFSQKSSLAFHERTHDKKHKRYACDECPRIFVRSDHFEMHKRCHIPEQAHVCTVCNMRFSTTTALKYHRKSHEHGKGKRYACTHCDKRFQESRCLSLHLRTHVVANRYPCPVCSKLYNRHYLPIHLRVHSKGSALKCPYCDETFTLQKKLTAHVRTHTHERPYTCTHCGQSYSSLTALRTHEASHDPEQKLKCKECNKRFLNMYTLRRHVKNRHEKKHYPCTFVNCSQVFAREMLLEDHVRREHAEERPFRCSRCDELFYSVAMLRDHERWKHQRPPLRHIESSSEDDLAVLS